MRSSMLLVHSPLVGPSSWAPTAAVLADRGIAVAVPDLTGVAEAATPRWSTFVDGAVAAAANLPEPIAVVGHSGAGVFLPAIGASLAKRLAWLVFVDALVPPCVGGYETPAATKAWLDEQTVGGRLRRWLEWWSDDVVEQLLPDPTARRLLLADMPQLPRSLYDEVVPVPDAWSRGQCAYLKLSDAYEAEFQEAEARRWPRRAMDANHLAIHTQPVRVADAILALMATGPLSQALEL